MHIYPYGIFEHESYRIACTILHRSDIKQPLNIFIQYLQCSIDNCLSNIIDKTCQTSSLISTTSNRVNPFQTQFISTESHILHYPSIGHQYICCYEQNDLITIAKAITTLSSKVKFKFIYKYQSILLKIIVICLIFINPNLV
jgi:hypothetical protein